MSTQPIANEQGAEPMLAQYLRVRQATTALTAELTPEDCQIQSMPDASPAK